MSTIAPSGWSLASATPDVRYLGDHLATVFGATVRGVLHYGSRAQGRASRPDTPFDFFVVVDRYGSAFRSLASRGATWRHARLATALSWVLPPSAVSVRALGADGEWEAKCIVISTRHLERECSRRARDHFVRGRIFQQLVMAWSRDRDSAEAIQRSLREVHEGSFDWVRVFLPPRFDVARYCRTLLEVSLAHEIRPESGAHAETLFAAQREKLTGIYGPVLHRLCDRGVLAPEGDGFRQRHPPGKLAVLRVRIYFRVSKLRASARLLKHPFLYDGWLDYLVRKIERSTGQSVELTERERRWPLVFLWPRAIRYIRSRPQRRP